MHWKVVWQELVAGLRQSAVRSLHLSQALQECMVFFGKDALQVAKAMPPNQPQPELLAAAARTAGTAQPRLRMWLATALVQEHQTHGMHTATHAVVNFDSLAIDLDDAAPEPEGISTWNSEVLWNSQRHLATPPGSSAPVTSEAAPRRTVLPATRRQQKAQSASQPGMAKIMVTLAPSAYKTTWAEITHLVRDATLVRALGDNIFKSLHVVNIRDLVCRNYLCCATDPTRRSPLTVFDGPTGSEGEHIHQPSYAHGSYHGTDVPHAHLCLWCTEDIHRTGLLKWLRSDLSHEFPALYRAVSPIGAPQQPERTRLPIAPGS